jgi:hypothetical protein
MDFGLAFSYVFEDEDWIKKIVITGIISIIPIIGQIALLGWSLEVARRVIRGDATPLPDWSDFGGLLTLGVKAFVISFVFALPLMFISIPSAFINSADSDSGQAVLTFLIFCISCFGLIYGLALAFFLPAAYGELAATDELGASFNIGKIFGHIRAAPSAYLLTFLGMIAAGILASFGVILCIVGVLFTGAYAYAVQGHLFGQAYKEATAGDTAA